MTKLRETTQPGTTSAQPVQYSVGKTLAVWAGAAVPMGLLAWVGAPMLAEALDRPTAMAESLVVLLAIGLVWQFVLVLWMVRREQGSLRWSVLRDALWLRSPTSPRSGRVGGRVWLVLVPLVLLFYAQQFLPGFAPPVTRDLGSFLATPAGEAFFQGAWGWYGLLIVMMVFNTVLGEEILFRGLLLPRMHKAFGRFDWLVNGVLFAAYHLHMPWAIPSILFDSFVLSYPSKRYRSAWIGIIVHSTQTIFFGLVVLALVV